MNEKVLQMAIQIPASMIDELGAQAFIDEATRAATAAATVMVKQYLGRDLPDGNGSNPHVKEKA